MLRMHADFQRYNPLRRPEWRWERILQMIDRDPVPGRCTKRDDDYIRTARSFVLRWRAKEDDSQRYELYAENPGLAIAYYLYECNQADPTTTLIMESRLLTRTSYEEIATLADTLPAAVQWYEALFFNVRDKLQARDWITKNVLVPAMMRNFGLFTNPHHASDPDSDTHHPPWSQQVIAKPFLDASLKMFAYFGGPHLCEMMIHGFQVGKLCNSPDDIPKYLDEHWSATIRMRSAQAARTFEINKFNVMELFMTHTRLIELERSEDIQGQQRNALEHHVEALMKELPWSAGEEEEDGFHAPGVLRYDKSAAELRDGELMQVAAGDDVRGLDVLEKLAVPPPSRKESKA